MRYQFSHTVTYAYHQPVTLQPHIVRLRPRSDGVQTLDSFSLLVTPTPLQQSQVIDLDSNALMKLWFDQDLKTECLNLQVLSHVETHCKNPFDYLLEPWAVQLPIDYPSSLLMQLQPYLSGQNLPYSTSVDPIALQLAQEINDHVGGDPIGFLVELTQRINKSCQYIIRETGEPLPPGATWSTKVGSCRDFTVLFVEVCRAIGLAARFVSGYQEGDPDSEEYHLHAWAEVYLPGAGWRGFDPTLGLTVADRHVALAASAVSRYTTPIAGTVAPASVQSTMSYQLLIHGH